jgi:hypothetical protein
MKLARFRKPKVICFISYVEYRPNTNTAILRKTGHAKGRSLTEDGRWKKEVKRVNMVDVLSAQELT